MKDFDRFDVLIHADPPAELDGRILAAATARARDIARRRLLWGRAIWSLVSAAAVVATVGIIWIQHFESTSARGEKARTEELLALADWSKLEQENYNLYFSLNSGAQAVSELSLQ